MCVMCNTMYRAHLGRETIENGQWKLSQPKLNSKGQYDFNMLKIENDD